MNRFGRKKTMVILLTAIIISGFANRFAPNYPAFLVGLKKHEYGHITLKVSENIDAKDNFQEFFSVRSCPLPTGLSCMSG